MTLKFDLLDKFIEQKQETTKAAAELWEREQRAIEEYEKLKVKYEETLKESVSGDKDKTAELDKIADEIEAAKKTIQRRSEERQMYSSLRPNDKIKTEDLIHAWNHEFIPEFHKKRFDAVLERLLTKKREYAEAELDYYKAVDELESILSDVRSEVAETYYYKFNSVRFNSRTQSDKYLIKPKDLIDIGRREMPQSLKYGGNE